MKKVYQTILRKEGGNCFRACFASILEIGIDDIPAFEKKPIDEWFDSISDFLKNKGYNYIEYEYQEDHEYSLGKRDFFHMRIGKSPRFDCDHVVVYKGSKMVHDPHPDNEGLKSIKNYGLIILSEIK